MTKPRKPKKEKTYWGAFKNGRLQNHGTKGFDEHPAIYNKKQDAKWHGGWSGSMKDVRRIRITEVK
jgi:hypothetical protein